MQSVWDILYLRRMAIDYVCPPVCEVIFSGSSNPVIILSNTQRGKVTGLVLGGFSGFRLSWNAFPGALCYNIYHLAPGSDVAVLLAECVQDGYELPNPGPGGNIVVTPITPDDGEGDPSDPIPYPSGGGGTSTVIVEATCPQTSRNDFPAVFRISREPGDIAGNLTVNYVLSGDAINGVHYDLIPLSATIPNGAEFVEVDISPVEAELLLEQNSVILTLSESPFYAVGTPSATFVYIRRPYLRIANYGGATPLFTGCPEAADAVYCEWDGTWNAIVNPNPPITNPTYYYQDNVDGNIQQLFRTIQGKQMWQTFVAGPYNSPTPGTWQVTIELFISEFDTITVWRGLKQGGDITDPSGTYIWNGEGCDTRHSLEIEPFPNA